MSENVSAAVDLQQIGRQEAIPARVHVNAVQRPRLAFGRHAHQVEEPVVQRDTIDQLVSQLIVELSIERV